MFAHTVSCIDPSAHSRYELLCQTCFIETMRLVIFLRL